MDVAPEWHEDWTRTDCAGQTRRCAGGDKACAEEAQRDGYVFISLYSLCKKEEVVHSPGTAAYASIGVGGALVIAAGVVIALRWRRKR
jgi:hypothetical protein